MLYHGLAHETMKLMADNSVDVCFADSPYNIMKAKSALPKYDKSQSIIDQNWTDFSGSWDVIKDYWDFTRTWLEPLRRVLKPGGNLFTTGTYHNIPVVQLVLKELGYHIVTWISWCKPNSFPNREMQEPVKANEVCIWARKSKKGLHFYNVERAKDYAVLDYWRRYLKHPLEKDGSIRRVNLRDYWLISNDARASRAFPFLVHGAKKPPELVARCIDITLPEEGGVVFDPFMGSGTTGYTCKYFNDWIMTPRSTLPVWHGSELYREYIRMCEMRLEVEATLLPSGLNLPVSDREEIAKKAGEWAPWVLDGKVDPLLVPELVRLWDAPRAKLSRPRFRKQDVSARNELLP